ncbi:MAG: phenylalanine--tRNA ligase subunit beta [Planctomyces sp.]|nr:phenylalanine--tRNA ligase subunit beta [Planctomyces sp.]
MIVSWKWLQDYVRPALGPEETADRLTMAGMNLESIEPRGDDFAIDLEITSNRPDCLGHLGIAREIGVVCGAAYAEPAAAPPASAAPVDGVTRVDVDCPDLCPQYIARVIRGVKVGPSPEWLRLRLETIGVAPVNNIVDVTNYVLFECGQPLHAFDFDRLDGGRIVVRRAQAKEQLEAIDHRTYTLTDAMCVIADARRPVAIGGVMGGAATEVGTATKNILIEAAAFLPSSIRATARALSLHSPSSYRFERGLDPERVDWASRRCCELILQVAGGELLSGAATAAAPAVRAAEPIVFRFARVPRILGIDIDEARCLEILAALGLERVAHRPGVDSTWRSPSWRRDLTREIDLIEEVARIEGYHHIPEDATLPTAVVVSRPDDQVRQRVQQVLAAAGFFETVTFSFTADAAALLFEPPGSAPALQIAPAAGEYGSRLRQSLLPSLILARRENERRGTLNAELYEISRVFLGLDAADPATQPLRLGIASGRSFRELKGVLEGVAQRVHPGARVSARPLECPGFVAGRGAELLLDGRPWGWMGELDRQGHPSLAELKLREACTVAEVGVSPLVDIAAHERRQTPLPEHPAVARDLNFVLDDTVSWESLDELVRQSAGTALESVEFLDQYSGKQIPAGKKSYVLSLTYRAADRTLTGAEVDASQAAVLEAVERILGGVQR